jgi:predicted nuclease of predicted toxin-antitoxin system
VKIKVDENLPESLVEELSRFGHDVDSVREEGLTGRSDDEVWKGAQTANRFFVTQDLDFSDPDRFSPGSHHGILLVRLPYAGRSALVLRIQAAFETEGAESWNGCFVVLSDHKIRVLRAKGT